MSLPERLSPVHDAVASLRGGPSARWGRVSNMPAVVSFGAPAAEAAAAASLGLADASALLRFTVKGPKAATWLQGHGISAPPDVWGAALLPGGGQVIRSGAEEIFVEDGVEGAITPRIELALRLMPPAGPYHVLRQDAAFFISGARARLVLAQTCGVDFCEPHGRLVMSRLAGVSAGIRFRTDLAVPAFQVWTDPSFGPYLWEQLHEIVTDLGGTTVGLGCFWPQLGS